MAMNHQWLCKESVLQDLAHLSGRFCYNTTINAVTDKPPIIPPEDAVDEDLCESLFGTGYTNVTQRQQSDVDPSYFNCIPGMLNMVKEFEGCPVVEPVRHSNKNIIVISKLNPNVEEFRPRSEVFSVTIEDNAECTQNDNTNGSYDNNIYNGSVMSDETNDIDITNNSPVPESFESNLTNGVPESIRSNLTNGVNVNINMEQDNESDRPKAKENAVNNKIDIQNMFKDEIESLKHELRLIKKDKSKRNVAMSNLVNLCPVVSEDKLLKPDVFKHDPKKPFKLLTPDDFMKKDYNNESSIRLINIESSPDIVANNCLEQPVMAKHHSNTIVANTETMRKVLEKPKNNSLVWPLMAKRHSNTRVTNTETMIKNVEKPISNVFEQVTDQPSNAELKESLDKVNRWLENKPNVAEKTPKDPPLSVLDLGAKISYVKKKRDSKTEQSSPSSQKLSSTIKNFQPSKQAEDTYKRLVEKMETKNKAKEGIWERAKREMLEKEERMKMNKNSETHNGNSSK